MKDFRDYFTIDWIGGAMFKVSFNYAHPRGTINRGMRWVSAKDVSSAEKAARELLAKTYTWYEITEVKAMVQT